MTGSAPAQYMNGEWRVDQTIDISGYWDGITTHLNVLNNCHANKMTKQELREACTVNITFYRVYCTS